MTPMPEGELNLRTARACVKALTDARTAEAEVED